MPITKKNSGPIELPKLERRVLTPYIIGGSGLIVHAWSKKAIIEMLAKQMGQKVPRFPKHPVRDFYESMYRMDDKNYGFPATAVKSALVEACTSMSKEISKKAAEQALYIKAGRGSAISAFSGKNTTIQLIPLYSPCAPQMREDSVRVGGYGAGTGKADLRYRAEFFPWAMRLELVFNAKVVSQSTVLNLLDTAGFACGLGEWRQERGGVNGQFQLATPKECKEIDKWAKKGAIESDLSADDENAFLERLQQDIKMYGEVDADAEGTAPAAVVGRPNGRNGNGAKERRQ